MTGLVRLSVALLLALVLVPHGAFGQPQPGSDAPAAGVTPAEKPVTPAEKPVTPAEKPVTPAVEPPAVGSEQPPAGDQPGGAGAEAGGEQPPTAGEAGGEAGEPAKPKRRPWTATEFEMENMTELEMTAYAEICKIRDDSILKMKQLARDNPNYPQIADIYYRIAEFTTENIRYRLAVQGREYKRDLARFKAGELQEEPEPPAKDYSATLPFYEKILTEHAKYPRAEEVLYYLGRNGVETGRSLGDDKLVERSVKVLNKLEEHFPKSRFLPQAFLMAGEYFFARNNLFECMKYYKKLVEEHKDAPMYLYALYKLGWTYYNYQQYDKTLVAFEEVIQSLREQGRVEDTLREMTLSDYVITISEAGQGWTAYRDFLVREVGADRAHSMLKELGKMMASRGFNDDAVAIYHYFIDLDVNSPEALRYWNEILNIYRWNFPFEEVETQVRQMRHFFRPDGSWMGNNQDGTLREEAADLLVKWDLSLAEFYLEGALYFNKGDDHYNLAISRCREILAQGAGRRQEQAWAGILLAYAGLIRTASAGRLIYVAENVQGPAYPDDYKLPKKLRRMDLDKYEQAYMEALDNYLALPSRSGQKPDLRPLGGVDMAANLLYHGALFNYLRGRNPEGLKYIDLLVDHAPKGAFLGWAGDMIFQMSARAEDWAGLQRRMKAMLQAGNTAISPEASLKEYLCSGMIEEALQLSAKSQFGDGMEKLASAGQLCQDNLNKAAEAYYQLGEVASQGGFIPQAREAYQKVIGEFGKSKYKAMAQRGLAKIKGK